MSTIQSDTCTSVPQPRNISKRTTFNAIIEILNSFGQAQYLKHDFKIYFYKRTIYHAQTDKADMTLRTSLHKPIATLVKETWCEMPPNGMSLRTRPKKRHFQLNEQRTHSIHPNDHQSPQINT